MAVWPAIAAHSAVILVCVLLLSLPVWFAGGHPLPSLQVPLYVYMYSQAAFFAATILNLLSLVFEVSSVFNR